MRRLLVSCGILVILASTSHASGMLIPAEKKLPPLALVDQKVTINIDEQVAVTRIEQAFRNHTGRQLEATYLFPVPKGASVRKFTAWVNGVEVPSEIVEADKARKIYTDTVSQTRDPGLLEYMNQQLIKVRVFPVQPNEDKRISLSYTSVNTNDNGLIEYTFPMRTDGKAAQTLEKFSITMNLKSQHPLTNIYSPTHPITIVRPNDKEATIGFEKKEAVLDRDFQLFYQAGSKDIGLTALTHRPIADRPGYFMMLLSPRAELSKMQQQPRDFVYVIDTSGSMRIGNRLGQAKNALKFCLRSLSAMAATNTNRHASRRTSRSRRRTIRIRRKRTTRIRRSFAWTAARKKSGRPSSRSGGTKSPRGQSMRGRFAVARVGKHIGTQRAGSKG